MNKSCVVFGEDSQLLLRYDMKYYFAGARVILACRDLDKGNEAAKEIREASKNERVICRQVNFASLESIRTFVQTFIKGRFLCCSCRFFG